jgi:hypothetical protein
MFERERANEESGVDLAFGRESKDAFESARGSSVLEMRIDYLRDQSRSTALPTGSKSALNPKPSVYPEWAEARIPEGAPFSTRDSGVAHSAAPVPEPTAALLFGGGISVVGLVSRRAAKRLRSRVDTQP